MAFNDVLWRAKSNASSRIRFLPSHSRPPDSFSRSTLFSWHSIFKLKGILCFWIFIKIFWHHAEPINSFICQREVETIVYSHRTTAAWDFIFISLFCSSLSSSVRSGEISFVFRKMWNGWFIAFVVVVHTFYYNDECDVSKNMSARVDGWMRILSACDPPQKWNKSSSRRDIFDTIPPQPFPSFHLRRSVTDLSHPPAEPKELRSFFMRNLMPLSHSLVESTVIKAGEEYFYDPNWCSPPCPMCSFDAVTFNSRSRDSRMLLPARSNFTIFVSLF